MPKSTPFSPLSPLVSVFALLVATTVTGCAIEAGAPTADESDELAASATVELAVASNGTCVMKTKNPTVRYARTVWVKNVGTKPLAASVMLYDDIGGMPAPVSGDVAPGKHLSVKMNTKFWVLEDAPEAKEWTTSIGCHAGPSADPNLDYVDVGEITVTR